MLTLGNEESLSSSKYNSSPEVHQESEKGVRRYKSLCFFLVSPARRHY